MIRAGLSFCLFFIGGEVLNEGPSSTDEFMVSLANNNSTRN